MFENFNLILPTRQEVEELVEDRDWRSAGMEADILTYHLCDSSAFV